MGIRRDGREPDDLRTLAFTRDFTQFAAGSVLVEFGMTRVLCTASVEERVPPWLRGKGRGWVTAEYSMLPGSTSERNDREAARGKQSGRTQEIQRLIGRSLRAVTDLTAMGEVQITVDCDVLQADGGTRTASICGGYVALHDACSRLVADTKMGAHPLTDQCAAISVGIVDALPYLDLDYSEDVRAEVDMNVVMTGEGRFVEVQGTAEGAAFSRRELDDLLGARRVGGIAQIFDAAARAAGRPATSVDGDDPVDEARPRHRQPRQGRRRSAPCCATPASTSSSSRARPTCPRSTRPATTLEENARLKAVALCDATGLPAVADDTGLEVDALGGAPGVYSARLRGRGRHLRRQRRQAAARARATSPARSAPPGSPPWRWPGGPTGARWRPSATSRASSRGEARGDGGFGYDPVFVPVEGDGRTFAEMTAVEKHRVSHRGRAFRTLADGLKIVLALDPE